MTKQGPQHKYEWSANRFNNPTSTFGTVSHDLHKLRRGALENMFSRQQVRHLLPLLQEKLAKMLNRFGEYQGSGKPINLLKAYMAIAEDVIFEYSFDKCENKLDNPGFGGELHQVFVSAGRAIPFFLQFPTVAKVLNLMSDYLLVKLDPGIGPLIKLKQVGLFRSNTSCRTYLDTDFIQGFEADIIRLEDPLQKRTGKTHATVMHEVINDPNLPPSEKTRQRLLDESQLVVGAGVATAGWTGSVAIYNILANPKILARVRQELYTVIPPGQKHLDCSDMDWPALESLPYFQACIKEALRLSYGLTSRTSRCTPKEIIYIEPATNSSVARQWHIPPNTPVSVSIYIHNHTESIFPDSHTFDPDRWLTTPRLPEKYFVTFGKGSRMCLGMQLAWAELSLMLAGTIRWFDMELFDTTKEDVIPAFDFSIPAPRKSSQGVRAKVLRELD